MLICFFVLVILKGPFYISGSDFYLRSSLDLCPHFLAKHTAFILLLPFSSLPPPVLCCQTCLSPPPLLRELSLRRGAAERTNRELTLISVDTCAVSVWPL